MDTLRKIPAENIGLTDEQVGQLEQIFRKENHKKKDFLIQSGQTCSFIGFVESGILRSYILKDGEEFNVDFSIPGSFVSSYTSFLTQTPTKGYIQALSDAIVYTISYTDYTNLLNSNPEWFKLGKYISDMLFLKKCRRETSLLMDSAADRYKLLLQTYPQIEQLVAQYHIASYLGIKPESLSRMKSLTYINE